MITKVEVMSQKDFDAWYKSRGGIAEADTGPGRKVDKTKGRHNHVDVPALLQVKGCIACHTIDGSAKIGPTLKGVFGKKEVVIREGKEREVVVDEAFIKQTLLHPEIDRVKGFPPIMPPQKGLLADKEIDEIIEYLKELK
jgi:cytochrome c oxidase subunit II